LVMSFNESHRCVVDMGFAVMNAFSAEFSMQVIMEL
jgi:hypothetical protein